MFISFVPQRRNDTLSFSVSGDLLTVNGVDLDFSAIEEGDVLPQEAVGSEWIVSDVTRVNGEIHLTLIKPHGPNPTREEAFPEPVTL